VSKRFQDSRFQDSKIQGLNHFYKSCELRVEILGVALH